MRSEPSHIPVLDGVRGFAALVVLIAHSAQILLGATFLRGLGQQGVALFFVLSGFLMTWLYAERPFNRANLRTYAVHRAGRVLPLYYAVILVSLLAGSSVIWTFPFSGPREFAEHAFLFMGQQTLWTIPIEVQFYVLFPILWRDASQGKPWRAISMLAAAFLSLALAIRLMGYDPPLLPMWGHCFLIGAGVALVAKRHTGCAQKHHWMGWTALALFFAAVPGLRTELGLPVGPNYWDPLTVGSSVLLFVACLYQLGPLRILDGAVPRWLGRVSYSVYLLHLPVLLTIERTDLPRGLAFMLTFAVTFALAELSFRYIETPARRWIASGNSASERAVL